MRDIKKSLKQKRERSYLNKDFQSFKSDLLTYARTFFSDNIADFSEASVGGLFLEMSSYVGDVMSFYLDHQFNELNLETAVESDNVERLVRTAGVKIVGSSPATVGLDFYVEVAASGSSATSLPDVSLLPIIKAGSVATSNSGISFELYDDVNFRKLDSQGNLKAEYKSSAADSAGTPTKFVVKASGIATSSKSKVETFSIPNKFVPFRTITLGSENVTEIISVKDSSGNEYFEVESLTQDVVFKRTLNVASDSDLVPENIEIIPAPYRFIAVTSKQTNLTTLRFGSGLADTLDDDVIPDPSEIALPIYGARVAVSKFSIDPNLLLQSKTLGISPINTTITAIYRAGGGLSHNVGASTIRNMSTLMTQFTDSISSNSTNQIRSTIEVDNPAEAQGGESAPTLNELRTMAFSARNAQSRIVSKEDLIARIYTMPSNFGRVFRVGISGNSSNPLASTIYIVSRNSSGTLIVSPDSLKNNLRLYLNQFRLISDAVDIVDASVINLGVKYSVVIDSTTNKSLVLQSINSSLKDFLKITNFQIDQPLLESDLTNLILNTSGVLSLDTLSVVNNVGTINGNVYSDVLYNVKLHTTKGIIIPPAGGIFEVRFPNSDIVGSAV